MPSIRVNKTRGKARIVNLSPCRAVIVAYIVLSAECIVLSAECIVLSAEL